MYLGDGPKGSITMKDARKHIFLVGGGSGGHLTPLVAVATALKSIDSGVFITSVGQRSENLHEAGTAQAIDAYAAIHAGKFRRYHSTGLWSHLKDVSTLMLNVRDFFRFIAGFFESIVLLYRNQPNVIMLKGGFVSVPVGYAARLLRIPYVTHDSDAIPGLANRLTARNARYNLTAMPIELYPYDQAKARQVGIPLRNVFVYVSAELQHKSKKELDFRAEDEVILVAGGGLGAQRVNEAVIAACLDLLLLNPKRHIIHLTGKKLFDETVAAYEALGQRDLLKQVHCIDFSTEPEKLGAAADLIITRAGATTIAEFALQAKPCIVIPSPYLTGGQQLHNAQVLREHEAAYVLNENHLENLAEVVNGLLEDKVKRQQLADNLHSLAIKDSADKIAKILLSITEEGL